MHLSDHSERGGGTHRTQGNPRVKEPHESTRTGCQLQGKHTEGTCEGSRQHCSQGSPTEDAVKAADSNGVSTREQQKTVRVGRHQQAREAENSRCNSATTPPDNELTKSERNSKAAQGSRKSSESRGEGGRRTTAAARRRQGSKDCRSAPQAVPQQNKMENNEHRKITARNEG